MKPDNLIEIRSKLGVYTFKRGGYCQLAERVDGTFQITIHEAGKTEKTVKCESRYILEQASYFASTPNEIARFTPKHPELAQFFSKTGKPITPATLLEDFIETNETKPAQPEQAINVFGALLDMVKDKKRETKPAPQKPFSFADWAETKDERT